MIVKFVRCFVLSLAGVVVASSACMAEEAASGYCQSFHALKSETEIDRGRRVDPLTVFLGLDVPCAEKKLEYGQAVTIATAKLRPGWRERLEKNWSAAYCKPGSVFLAAIRKGWTISSLVRTNDGQAFQVVASCHDATA